MSTQTMSRNFARSAGSLYPRTPGQVNFIQDLLTQIATYDRERGVALWNELRDEDRAGQLTFSRASETINALKTLRAELRLSKQASTSDAAAPKRPEVPEGRYAVETDEGHLAFYQVEVSSKGFFTVYLQTSDELRKMAWSTAQGVLVKIEKDPKAASIRYGQELGVCGVCNRTLTNEESRAKGIGPVCESRF